MVEHLKAGAFYCNVCGQAFMLNDAGKLISREETNHAPNKRKTDINGYPIDE